MLLFFATNMAAVTSYQPEISTLAGTIMFITKAKFLKYTHMEEFIINLTRSKTISLFLSSSSLSKSLT